MAEYYALTSSPLPATLHGNDAVCEVRTLSERERLAIEDYFFRKDIKVTLGRSATAVIVPHDQAATSSLDNFAVVIEFALAVLTVSGFEPVSLVASLSSSSCSDAQQRSYREIPGPPTFAKKVVKSAASTWIHHFLAARRKAKDGLHITVDRFVRYSRQNTSPDALVDLCICLESLIESQNEVSFRFATTLAKVTGYKKAEEISDLLTDLYALRSKVVHGTDYSKAHKRVDPNIAKLRWAARSILTTYVLFMTGHTKEQWTKHLSTSLFA